MNLSRCPKIARTVRHPLRLFRSSATPLIWLFRGLRFAHVISLGLFEIADQMLTN
jgi:hypothetical protein